MYKPALVGLPGTGKSTVLKLICEQQGWTMASTDTLWDAARAMPAHPVTAAYIAGFEANYGQQLDVATMPVFSTFQETYGTSIVRDLEEQIVCDYFRQGYFIDKVPDLGGSVFMRAPVRESLIERGFVSVFLQASPEKIARQLLADYEFCKSSGEIFRGNYYGVAAAAEAGGNDPYRALYNFSEEQREIRTPFYTLADISIQIPDDETPIQTAARIGSLLSANKPERAAKLKPAGKLQL